ncbi:uncharacterized protein LOC124913000 [Impatiens glandulifera]|uniref:uncharacterized protein LOC124913000 n=1 Tax=Impatiens glandulifera TaxID=253017 RepID=UPI001FB0E7E7|nr:uncharacterized protein LOC124913000 [Impatiens glandulifera]
MSILTLEYVISKLFEQLIHQTTLNWLKADYIFTLDVHLHKISHLMLTYQIVFHLRITYPSLHFYDGGVEEFVSTIKQHFLLAGSEDDANAFFLKDFQHPLKRTLIFGQPRLTPLSCEEWSTFLDSEGRIVDPKGLRKRIFYGGVDLKIRSEVWPLLLGHHAYDATCVEKQLFISLKKFEYENIKKEWQSLLSVEEGCDNLKEMTESIALDVARTDTALPFYQGDENPNVKHLNDILVTYSYHFNFSYCQGMGYILSSIFYILQDESETFWCFTELMKRIGQNFSNVELVTRQLSAVGKEIYMAVAILKRYRHEIVDNKMDFGDIHMFIDDLSMKLDLKSTLWDAEALFIFFGDDGVTLIPRDTPFSLPKEQMLRFNLDLSSDHAIPLNSAVFVENAKKSQVVETVIIDITAETQTPDNSSPNLNVLSRNVNTTWITGAISRVGQFVSSLTVKKFEKKGKFHLQMHEL